MKAGVRAQIIVREGGDDPEEAAEIAEMMERADVSVFAMVPVEGTIFVYGKMNSTDEKADQVAGALDAQIAEYRRQRS